MKKVILIILFLIVSPMLFFKIYPPKSIKFKSMDINLPLDQLTNPGRIDLVENLDFRTKSFILNINAEIEAITCPQFDPNIRRYSWTPYSKGDILIIKYRLSQDVVKITINDQFHDLKQPIRIPFRKASEYFIKFHSSDTSFASYVVVATPIDFAPIRGVVIDPTKVENGYILSDFYAPGLTSIVNQLWMSLYSFGVSAFTNTLAQAPFSKKVLKEAVDRLDRRRKYRPYFFVLDKYGVPIYLRSNNLVASNFQKTEFGYSIGVNEVISQPGVYFGENLILDANFKVTDEKKIIANSKHKANYHVFYKTKSNGYILAANLKSVDRVSGKDIYNFYFQEQKKNGDVIFEWNSKNFFKPALSWVLDSEYSTWNYFDGNSITLSNNNNFLVTSGGLKSVINIDRKSGKPIWLLGDKDHGVNDFKYINDEMDGPSVVYYANQLSNGNILLFDSGDWIADSVYVRESIKNATRYSRVVEYKIDEENLIATKILEISHKSSQSHIGGSAVRLPKGNTLVAWGSMGYITEHEKNGKLVLELDLGGIVNKAVKITPHHLMKNL